MNRLLASFLFSLLYVASAWPQRPVSLFLEMYSYGYDTYAAWKISEGLPDSSGGARFAIELEKDTDQPNARAYVYVRGLEGQPVSFLTQGTGVSWEHRNDGYCGHTPVWAVGIIPKNSTVERYLVLRCNQAMQSMGSGEGWIKDSFSEAYIIERIQTQFGSLAPDVLEGKITYVAVLFYSPMSSVYLDNVRVNDRVWTSPFDARLYCPRGF